MEKVKPEIIVITDDDNDDEPDCKPTRTKKKLLTKKKKRKVERTINTSSNTETLVITQKVKEQKFKCIINLTNVCEHREENKHEVKCKNTKINAKEYANVKKIVPDCLRKKCKIDLKRKYDNYFSRIRKKELHRKQLDKSYKRVKPKSFERKKFKYSSEISEDKHNISSKDKIRRVEPSHRSKNHTRYLSPISSDSLSDLLSETEDMSYEDISSDSTTEIDTLIKRTKDRERNSSLNRSYEFNLWSSTSLTRNNTSRAEVTEKHDKIKDSESLENADLEIYKCRNKICAVQPVTHSPRYDCIKDISDIPLPNTDPNHASEYIIDIDGTYEPNFMSTPKHEKNTETHDASASDGGTVLTGEMDIVSFHSQGTLVLDTFYSPSHPTGSPSFIYDAYSPIMSPTLLYHEDVIENTPTHCDPSHLMPPDLKNLITNSAGYTASQGLKPYSPDSPIITFPKTNNIQNLTDITLETNVKQEQLLKSNDVKVEHTSPKIDIGSATNVSTNFDIRSVKVEGAEVSEKRTIEAIFESPNINVNIKKEINEDSINNNITLKPYHMRNLSTKMSNKFKDVNLEIKKEE